MMKNFELFMGCLGNGITVCNKAVTEGGNYKTVAHIGDYGRIKIYVSPDYIPVDAMDRIMTAAATRATENRKRFEQRPELEQYRIILDYAPNNLFMKWIVVKEKISDILPEMRRWYYENY